MSEASGHRERRPWTEDEDAMLLQAIAREDPDGSPPSKWHAIAMHLPNRTNKDCRKRWWAQMATTVAKGGWSADEDERLSVAVEEFGTKWALVATKVLTRNSGQCAKRWNDALNPAIDRSDWTEEEDVRLLQAVQAQGKAWTSIVRAQLPGRTGLAAKNRYNHLVRNSSDRTPRPRDHRKAPYGGKHSPAGPSSSSSEAECDLGRPNVPIHLTADALVKTEPVIYELPSRPRAPLRIATSTFDSYSHQDSPTESLQSYTSPSSAYLPPELGYSSTLEQASFGAASTAVNGQSYAMPTTHAYSDVRTQPFDAVYNPSSSAQHYVTASYAPPSQPPAPHHRFSQQSIPYGLRSSMDTTPVRLAPSLSQASHHAYSLERSVSGYEHQYTAHPAILPHQVWKSDNQ